MKTRHLIAATLAGVALGAGASELLDATPAPKTITRTVVRNDPTLPPLYGRTTPSWCQEDMACWDGTSADGRTESQVRADWSHLMHTLMAVP